MLSFFNLHIILTVLRLVQYSDGNQRIVYVSELISDDKDFFASGEDDNSQICCVYGNCSCSSLNQALTNLTSNVLINIATNVTLSSLVIIPPDIVNVTIIGHNNPIVNCKDSGRVRFTSCDNCTIQGITWDGCGTDDPTEPGLKLSNSSNINIKNCFFQYSKGQALLLSEITGDVNIDHCEFVHNSHYKRHGAAIHYSSNDSVFMISDCNFAYNSAQSLVYTENTISKHKNNIFIRSTKFCHNQGVSVYAVNKNIILNGKIFFHNNTAEIGAGIYISDHSTVIFGETSDVAFTQNSANSNSGSLYLRNHSNVIFDKHSMVTFHNNKAYDGGTIYSEVSSNITFKANCKVTFSDNSAVDGGAIYSITDSYIIFEGSSSPVFSNNSAGYFGGAIYSITDSYIIFEGSSSPVFSNNIADDGGAICSDYAIMIFNGNSSPVFSNNSAADFGGAIYSVTDSYIVFEGSSSPVFSNNIADDGGAIYLNYAIMIFNGNSSPVFSNNIADKFGGAIYLDYKFMIFNGNSSPVFSNNAAMSGGAIAIYPRLGDNRKIIFEENSFAVFDNNTVTREGGAIYASRTSNISFRGFSTVEFRNNVAEYGGAVYAEDQSDIMFSDYSTVTFTNNSAAFGATTFSDINSKIIATGNSTVILNDRSPKWCNSICLPYTGQGDVTIDSNGIVWCSDQKAFVCESKECDCDKLEDLLNGLEHNTLVNITNTVTLSSVITLQNRNISIIGYNNITVNCVNGGGLKLLDCSNVIIEGITWIGCGNYNNTNDVPVIHLTNCFSSTNIRIQKCTFQYSLGKAISHIVRTDWRCHNPISYLVIKDSYVIINNCNFMNNNHWRSHGAAIFFNSFYRNINISNCIFHYNGEAESIIYFGELVVYNRYSFQLQSFIQIIIPQNITHLYLYLNTSSFYSNQGVSVYLSRPLTLHINGEVLIENNIAESGAGIYISDNSTVIFDENSTVKFINNSVDHDGAAIFTNHFSNVIFEQNSMIKFQNNKATRGTIYSENNSFISFESNSFTLFTNNVADYGAAIFSLSNSFITFKHNSTVIFNSNIVEYCGVLTSILFSSIIYKDNTRVSYNGNIISRTSTSNNYYETSAAASAMCIFQRSDVIYSGHSLVSHTAGEGGAITSSDSNVIIEELSTVSFNNNVAQCFSGGAFTCYNNSNITIKGNSNVTFNSNKAGQDGGAIYSFNICKITFKDNSTSTFVNNTARNNGGAILSSQLSDITLEGNSTIIFNYNTADNGGAVCIDNNVTLTFEGNSTAFFNNNVASEGGGAMKFLKDSNITVKENTAIKFTNNSAQYGGAIFLDTTAAMVSNSDVKFSNNNARIMGSSLYQYLYTCKSSCLGNRTIGISNKLIATPPNELKFYDPAVCIDNNNNTQCSNYYIQNIMLGSEIVIPVCLLDYYNQSVDSIQFLIQSDINTNYSIDGAINGAKHVVISCGTFTGISIIGNHSLSQSTNFSITITLNTALYPNWRQISVNLIIELSPCHPGFWQYNSSRCECYNAKDIVFCSSSTTSTIKRGYWFGSVTGRPTVTFCPINYCNFTCCETSTGYYHLSPVRDNQCRSHRSGTSCGSCVDGYTLSFDSTECVSIDSCTAGKTVLVILLTVIYWIVMVTLIFVMMYYKVGIGYLYSITYYYSIVDILLNQNLQASRGLYLTVSIMSSFSKITPQFLGELCLTTGMSGIDQQFIHYIHPSAVIVILMTITLLARRSQNISAIISRGIIHVICLLLLLSYTSIVSTSLLLMRSLSFHGIDKVYTYLSPDIEYFHGRHLAYGMVALLCTVTIALGLPLLLILEPFLNGKINFTKIKPLLDQFQGCYKDKYRCFAGYYMICRLVIITIVIANSSNEFVANYLLITVCGIVGLIHLTLKPYNKKILNELDGIILHLIIFVAALAILDDIDSPSVMTTVYALVLLPLLIFFGMTCFLHKHDLKKIITHFNFRNRSHNSSNDVNNNNEISMREFDLIVDDSMRNNATICDIK